MNNSINARIKKIYADSKHRQIIYACICAMSFAVACCVFWQLRLVGVTKTAEPCCGVEEHVHSNACEGEKVLACGFEETKGEQLLCTIPEHSHSSQCFAETSTLICAEEHEHEKQCFATESILTCDMCEHTHDDKCKMLSEHIHSEECYVVSGACELEEHEHSILCYSDISADIESEEDWTRTLPAHLGLSIRGNIVSVAKSQLGYKESERNFVLSEDGSTRQHYTRYGQWYGNPYGNWNAMFASFCISYAGVPQSQIPYSSNTSSWITVLENKGLLEPQKGYVAQPGDIVFFRDNTISDKTLAGITVDVSANELTVIAGDIDGAVNTLNISTSGENIVGYVCIEMPSADEQLANSEDDADSYEQKGFTTEMTAFGDDYSISVVFTEMAEIPATAELHVKELAQYSTEYDQYYQKTLDAMNLDAAPIFCRFFDIAFVDDGTEIEPKAPVDVVITYSEVLPVFETDKCTAVHFAETGLELIDAQLEPSADGDIVTFTQDSFSVVGTVVEGSVSLTTGQNYVFYTGDGYALGVSRSGSSNYAISPIKVDVGNNGYITPSNPNVSIDNITWTYRNGGLYNAYSGRYLNLVASTPRLVTGTRYTSTVGLSTSVKTISSFDINNSLRISQNYGSYRPFMLAYENNVYKSGTEFDNAQIYHLTALVTQVSDELVQPGNLTVQDQIRESGHIVPKWNVTVPAGELTYVWEKSLDGGLTWNTVNRQIITGEEYNVAEDGSGLNVALDGGAEAAYRVSLVAIDGQTLSNPVVSQMYWVPYFDELKNGNFELPVVPYNSSGSDYQPFMPNGTAQMVWKTTASDGQIEYVSVANPSYQSLSKQWHLCEAANDGNQYVELNATRGGALYQDVLTIPGSTMYWQLAHRARGTQYLSGQVDTTYVVIMSTALAEQYNITTQSAVQDVLNNPSRYPGAQVETITSDNKQWHISNGQYVVPEEQYLSRYFFVSGATASRDLTVGNHLDSVSFSINLPPPVPGKTNIEVIKRIEGLSYADAAAVLSQLEFWIDSENHQITYEFSGADFSRLVSNGDGTYSAQYALTGITPGRYEVVEDTIMGNADITGYVRATSIQSESAIVNGFEDNGKYGIVVRANANTTARVTVYNSYTRQTAEITVIKKGSDDALLQAGFELFYENEDAWEPVLSFETENGRAVVENLSYETIYRLSETTPPNGYVGLINPVYFVIRGDGIHLCSENGEPIQNLEDIIIDELEITVINEAGYTLPETGGEGIYPYIFIGLLLLGSSLLFTCGLRRSDERRLKK